MHAFAAPNKRIETRIEEGIKEGSEAIFAKISGTLDGNDTSALPATKAWRGKRNTGKMDQRNIGKMKIRIRGFPKKWFRII